MLQAYGKPQVNPAPLEIYIVFYSLMLLPIVLSQKQETRANKLSIQLRHTRPALRLEIFVRDPMVPSVVIDWLIDDA